MNHKNITCENCTTEIVIRCCLLLEECRNTIKYIKGPDTELSYALSRITLMNYEITEINVTRGALSERYIVDKLDSDTFLLT